jgi:hypothetical protein
MSVAAASKVYTAAVLERARLENEVSNRGHELRVLESSLRKAREAERKALLDYSAAVEAHVGPECVECGRTEGHKMSCGVGS